MADDDIFDPKFLLDSVDGDTEIATQVIALFLSDIPEELDAFDAAIAACDGEEIHRLAHLIKGSAATVGAELLRRVALEGEECGRDGRLEGIESVAFTLREAFERTSEAMRRCGFA